METRREHKRGDLGRRLMAGLLLLIAVCVVVVFLVFGLNDPTKGPGNVPANGEATPLRDNGSPPTSK
jgi:hypothetical protein